MRFSSVKVHVQSSASHVRAHARTSAYIRSAKACARIRAHLAKSLVRGLASTRGAHVPVMKCKLFVYVQSCFC